MTTATPPTDVLHRRSVIGGQPVALQQHGATFSPVDPRSGQTLEQFAEASVGDIDDALGEADAAAAALAATSPGERAAFLRELARALEAVRPALVARANLETAIGVTRLEGELTRTTRQLEAFADHVATGAHQNIVKVALPEGSPARDLRRMTIPLGVIVVFGASNFPLAFGTPGGDTASALAAGCPVVVKGHPSHPGTSEIVARAFAAAIEASGLPAGVFSLLQGASPELSRRVVLHPIAAGVGFTGSRTVGRILADLAASRDVPIQVHAEMGSSNPVFVTEAALSARGSAIAAGLASSITFGSGQLCTKPGLIFVPTGETGDDFVATLGREFATRVPIPLLNSSVQHRFAAEATDAAEAPASWRVIAKTAPGEGALNAVGELTEIAWDDARSSPEMLAERFGPAAVVVRLSEDSFADAVPVLDGQLTFTIHGEAGDAEALVPLVSVLAQGAGRVVWNGYPTGVAVSAAMTHGGPFPASSTPTTSVGLSALDRFLRPVTFQDFPAELLPVALRD
jgi:acyl-CoA reductase-like NAD-dependent aldehyde dehydrogenase